MTPAELREKVARAIAEAELGKGVPLGPEDYKAARIAILAVLDGIREPSDAVLSRVTEGCAEIERLSAQVAELTLRVKELTKGTWERAEAAEARRDALRAALDDIGKTAAQGSVDGGDGNELLLRFIAKTVKAALATAGDKEG